MEKNNQYLRYFYLFAYCGIPMLPVSLNCQNCQMLIVSSVFSNVYIETCGNSLHRICYNRNNKTHNYVL
jgi:hypothetical protein